MKVLTDKHVCCAVASHRLLVDIWSCFWQFGDVQDHKNFIKVGKLPKRRAKDGRFQQHTGLFWFRQATLLMDFSPPGSTALQLIFHPVILSEPLRLSVLNKRLTTLLLLIMVAGRQEPQVFSIKVVPSPSVMVRWSQAQSPPVGLEHCSMSKAVNCRIRISPSFTRNICFFSRLGG